MPLRQRWRLGWARRACGRPGRCPGQRFPAAWSRRPRQDGPPEEL